jgi:fructose-1,6-bisphosphatase/inositol monophosphatase family enzyme
VISKLIGHCRGIRALGSAAMNMCTVAKGGSDIYYEKGIHCWVGYGWSLAHILDLIALFQRTSPLQ